MFFTHQTNFEFYGLSVYGIYEVLVDGGTPTAPRRFPVLNFFPTAKEDI